MTGRGQRASVLFLMPAGVLVVLLLGAIAFDMSLVFLRQRQASTVAVDVANDLASLAIDRAEFRRSGAVRLDPSRAEALAPGLLDGTDIASHLVDYDITIPDLQTVRVEVVVSVDYVFARSVPGVASETQVRASATATAADG